MYYYAFLVLTVLIEDNFASQKYHFVHGADMTWFEAKEYCDTTYHTELATIITQADLDTAKAQVVAEAGLDHTAWIGFTDLFVLTPNTSYDLGYWRWLDGTPCGCDFQSNTPCDANNTMWPYVNLADHHKHCAEMRTKYSELTTTECEVRTSVLCNAYQYECVFIKEKHDSVKKWKGANEYCKETYGTELATLSTASLQNEARGLCINYEQPCFIGLTDSVSENAFKWADGTRLYEYSNWAPGQPDDYSNGEDCVEMIMQDGKWNDMCCDYASYDTWLCNVAKSIEITACDGWSHSSYSNSLRVQVHGVRGSTAIFPLNRVSVLPLNGSSMTFDVGVDKFEDSGQPYGIDLIVDDPKGYCIKNVSVNFGNYTMDFGEDHFGNGIILSAKCGRSFVQIREDVPLLPCLYQPLELYNNTPRGIHNVSIHTCNMDNAGIAFTDMSDSLYAVITGKKPYSNAYSSTKIMPLDHYVAGSLNVQYLGVLVATNVLISSGTGIAFIGWSEKKNQTEANAYCSDTFSTQLATITSQTMNQWAENWCGDDECWIGYERDSSATDGWAWIKEAHSTGYVNWAQNEPSDVAEKCAVMTAIPDQAGWADITCSNEAYRWLCDINGHTSDHAYFIPTSEVYSPQTGVVIGVKIESVNYDDFELVAANFEGLSLTNADGSQSGGSTSHAYDNGRYVIVDLEHNLTVSEYAQITISNSHYDVAKVNIYFIFKEATSTAYQLPFIYETQTDPDIPELNWFHANKACAEKYGTSLASIHSEAEQFLVNMYRETDDDQYWIGLNDVETTYRFFGCFEIYMPINIENPRD